MNFLAQIADYGSESDEDKPSPSSATTIKEDSRKDGQNSTSTACKLEQSVSIDHSSVHVLGKPLDAAVPPTPTDVNKNSTRNLGNRISND